MRNLKHIIAIILALVILVGGGVFLLPKLGILQDENAQGKGPAPTSLQAENASKINEVEKDTLTFEEKLQKELQTVKTEYSKRRKRNIWTLGRGKTIIVYLLQAQRFVNKMGGQVLYMEEIYDRSSFQTAQVDILKPDQDTLRLELQVSESIFRDDASMLAVGFQVTKMTPELIVALNQLDYPFDLLVPPFGMSEDVYRDIEKIKNKEIVLWVTMESTKLNQVHKKLRPLRIHHTEALIEMRLDSAKLAVPNAVGLVTRYGEQAVEHKQLLQAILKPTAKNKLWFLDATANKLSKINEDFCKDFEIKCKQSSPYNPDNSALSDYIRSKMREANKKGLAAMLLPLTLDNLSQLEDLSAKAKKQGTSIVNLSTFMKY